MSTQPPPLLLDIHEELVGDRVRLRPFQAGDGPALWEATEESRENIGDWMAWIHHNKTVDNSESYARTAYARWLMREGFAMGIWEKDSGRLLGQCLLVRPEWSVPSIEMGYWVRTSAQGKGYVTEAGRLMLAFAFETLGMQRVHIRCDSLNRRSAAVAERLGFLLEGCLRHDDRSIDGDEFRDTLVYGMTAVDYANRGMSTAQIV